MTVQKLESELKAVREKEAAEIKQKINGILAAAGNCGAVELVTASTRLDTKFNDVKQQINDNCNKFRLAGEHLNTHRGNVSLSMQALDYEVSDAVFNVLLSVMGN